MRVLAIVFGAAACAAQATGTLSVSTGMAYSQPPEPLEERVVERPGFIWIKGHWDWRDNQWAWAAGRWEPDRAGYTWHEGRWERRGDAWHWIEGRWESE